MRATAVSPIVAPRNSRLHYLLIAGVALAAMTAGHALTAGLGALAVYRHIAQGPASDLAAVLFATGVWAAVARLLKAGLSGERRQQRALAAFDAIRAMGPARVAAAIVPLQLLALASGESLEQRAAGVSVAGLAAIFGSALVWAPVIHIAIGSAAAIALWLASSEICQHANDALRRIAAIAAWLAPERGVRGSTYLTINRACRLVAAAPLSTRSANRPPPSILRAA
jgi:hypothetical protein